MTYHVNNIHVIIITTLSTFVVFTLQGSCVQDLHALFPVYQHSTDRLGIVTYLLLPEGSGEIDFMYTTCQGSHVPMFTCKYM